MNVAFFTLVMLFICFCIWLGDRATPPPPDSRDLYLSLLPPERREALERAEYRRKWTRIERDLEHVRKLRTYVFECCRDRDEKPAAVFVQGRERDMPWGNRACFWVQFADEESPREAFDARPVLYYKDDWDGKPKYLRIGNLPFDEGAPLCGESFDAFLASCAEAFTSLPDGRAVGVSPKPSTWGRKFAMPVEDRPAEE